MNRIPINIAIIFFFCRLFGTLASEDFQFRFLQDELLDRYEIGESRISFAGKTINLTFPINNLNEDGTVAVKTFSDHDCSVNIDGNDYLMPDIIYDNSTNTDGESNREVTVMYTVDPTKIQSEDVWTQNDNDEFYIKFCMDFGLKLSSSQDVVISSLETLIYLKVELVGDFASVVYVDPGDQFEEEAEQTYFAEGFLCDENKERITIIAPRTQGSVVRVCVKPSEEALGDGVYMRSVDSFVFQRDDFQGNSITQDAVRDGRTANEALTQLFCNRGDELCYFDTILRGDFYKGAGVVNGFGEAWLQFGRTATRSRRLVINLSTRSLRVQGGFAGSSYFNLNFFVVPSEDFAYQAIAYECDTNNKRVEEPAPKVLGHSVRICVTPDEKAREFGVVINRIETWNFTRSGIVQPAIEMDSLPAENGMTAYACVPGSLVCAFKTQFIPEYFDETGYVDGFGSVVLQFSSNIAYSRRLERSQRRTKSKQAAVDPYGKIGRKTEGLELLVAGKSLVNTTTSVAYLDGLPNPCAFEHKVTEWWVQEDINDRYKYIGFIVGSLLAIGTSLLLCWLFPCFSRNEDVEVSKDGKNVMVNVDLTNEKQENNISTMESKSAESKRLLVDNDPTDEESATVDSPDTTTISTNPSRRGKRVTKADDDVCLNEKKHPGTHKLLKVIRRLVKNDPDEEFGPKIYRSIKNRLDGARFIKAVGKGKYEEPDKKEIVEMIGKIYEDARESLTKDSGSAGGKESRSSRRSSTKRSSSARSFQESSDDDEGRDERRRRRKSRDGDESRSRKRRSSSRSISDLDEEESDDYRSRKPRDSKRSSSRKRSSSKHSLRDDIPERRRGKSRDEDNKSRSSKRSSSTRSLGDESEDDERRSRKSSSRRDESRKSKKSSSSSDREPRRLKKSSSRKSLSSDNESEARREKRKERRRESISKKSSRRSLSDID